MKLIGYHVNATLGGIPEFIGTVKPAAVVVLDGTGDWGWVIEACKDTTHMVWRGFRPDEPDFEDSSMNPMAAARSYVEWSMSKMGGVPWDYVLGPNEPVIRTEDGMKRLAVFEAERARLLRQRGYAAAIGTFAVGNPGDMGLLNHFMPAIQAIHDYRGVLSLHQYGKPENLKLDSDWLILRHRKMYNGEPSMGWEGFPDKYKNTPLILTETGGDELIYSTSPGGWQNHMESEEYVDELAWLDDELIKDSYVLGAAVFCSGNIAPQWITYDVWTKTAAGMANRFVPVYRKPKYYTDPPVVKPPSTERAEGVDVSWHQKNPVNWRGVRVGGRSFAIARSSYRLSKDTRFELHYYGAKEEGFINGMYHYLYDDASPVQQAHFFSSLVNRHSPHLPPVVDVEQAGLTSTQIRSFIETFRAVQRRRLMIYTSRTLWHRLAGRNATWAEDCLLWVADWGDRVKPLLPDIWDTWEFWQYWVDPDGIPGYSGRIDVDRYHGSETMLHATYGAVDICR